jgi:xylulokinase
MGDLILAHDLGTTGNKASLFDTAGRAAASAFVPYATHYPHPGWAEQEGTDWWRAICASTRQLVSAPDRSPSEVGVVSFSGQMMGCLPLGADLEPLCPALIWADQRATAEAELLSQRMGADAVYRITGHRASASYTAAKLLWLMAHRPEVMAQARHVVLAKDYAALRLTGVLATDYSDASGTNLFDLRARRWSDDIIAALGVDRGLLSEPVPSATVIGAVTPQSAAETGLLAGTPVVIGGGDGACATAGAGVVAPGDAYSYVGSSSWIAFVSREPLYDPEQRTFTFAHLDPEYLFPTGTMQCAGGSLDWLERILRGDAEAKLYEELDALAGQVSPGADGLFFLPYLMGERSPHWNPKARGAFVGLSLSHGRGELARAVLEGVMYNLRIILDAFRQQGASIPTLRLIGGGARSGLWRQIAADILGVPILRPELLVEATSLGAAIAGGVGVGMWSNYAEAGRLIAVGPGEQPDRPIQSEYDRLFPIFEELYADLVPTFERIALRTSPESRGAKNGG